MSESTTTPTAPAGQTAPTVTPSPVAPHSHAGISETEAATMAGWVKEDLAKGKITQAQADKIFDDLNVSAGQRVTPADQRTDDQRLIEEHFPAARESNYTISYYPPGQAPPVLPKEVAALDTNVRGWLAGAEFPRDHGNSLVSAVSKVLERTHAMNADQLDQYGADEYVKLQRVYGEALEEKLSAAGRMIEALEKTRPGLKQFLKTRGVGDSALVASAIIQQAERYWARRR
jgi:hypothetical protein